MSRKKITGFRFQTIEPGFRLKAGFFCENFIILLFILPPFQSDLHFEANCFRLNFSIKTSMLS